MGGWVKVQIALISLAAVLVTCLPPLARADHQVTRWYGGRGAAISVTFDDGLVSQVTVGAPLLNARGLKGTFYVMSDPGWNAWPTYWEDWAVVAAAGHEIGSHTISHAHLATLTETEIRTELRESRRTIELMIDQPLGMTIAYPFGETTPQVEALTSEYYIAGRDVWSPGYMNYYSDDSADPVDFYAIGSYAFDYPEITTYETLAAFVDTAQATQAWFIPHIHSLETAQAQGVLAAFLDDLAGRENLWVDTLGSVVRYMRERSAATLTATESKEAITLMLTHDLDSEIYNHLLTVRSTVPASWSGVTVTQGGFVQQLEPMVEGSEFVVYYDVLPNGGAVFLTPGGIDNLPPGKYPTFFGGQK